MKINSKLVFKLGILLGVLAMIAGSAGAHSIKFESDYHKELFNTGTFYIFVHIPVLMILGVLGIKKPAILLFSGILLFSVPLWTKAVGVFNGGIIVPVGGMMMIAAWIWLLFVGNEEKKSE